MAFKIASVCFAWSLGAACFAGTGTMAKSYAAESEAYNECMEGERQLNSGNYTAARDVLIKAASLDPTAYSSNVHYDLSRCYQRLGDDTRAIAEAVHVLQLDSSNGSALYGLAGVYAAKRDYKHAVTCLEKLLALCRDEGQRTKAKEVLRQIVCYQNVREASNLMESGNAAGAKKLLEQAARYDPSVVSGTVHAMLAFAARKMGQPAVAVAEGKKALTFDPNDKSTVYTIGIAYGDLSQFDEGISWIQKYLSMESDTDKRQDAANAIKLFQSDKSLLADPENKSSTYLESDRARWAKERLPIKVYLSPGNNQFGFRPNFPTYITRALDNWCLASGRKLSYVLVKSPDDSDIQVEWTGKALEPTDEHANARPAGLTEYLFREHNLTRAHVSILLVDPFDPKRCVSDGECAGVCMHEIGHALGLNHSKSMVDVMYYRANTRQTGFPTARDKATIALMYSDYPALNFVPKTDIAQTPKFVPPPTFMPPKAPDTSRLVPPMFTPPPLPQLKPPPMFTPPPLSSVKGSTGKGGNPPMPMFVPPPAVRENKKNVAPPMFVPPPAK